MTGPDGADDLGDALERAAQVIGDATALVVSAGAGMGVDSGLPDFRGDAGFWNAYPPYAKLGLSFMELANPRWFEDDPTLAWGFYGHRLLLYRRTQPHAGFAILKRWAESARDGFFVYTSNVDGQFQRAGFDPERVLECHGALDFIQCGCGLGIVSADGVEVAVDPESFRAREPLPRCPACGALVRPNVLMFGDWGWDAARTEAQHGRLNAWLLGLPEDARLVVVECGAGTAVPSVRMFGESLLRADASRLVRINSREPLAPRGQIGIASGALAALQALAGRVPVDEASPRL